MKRRLTALQRSVIQRLRDGEYGDLAEAAQQAWTHAEGCPPTSAIAEPELMEAYRKANAQLLTGFVDRRDAP
jgi:hypothetical protein